MRAMLLLAAGILALVPVRADAMTVAEFLAKVDALKAKGPLALFSPDIRVLKAEMAGIARGYRDELQAQRAAGAAPHSCPPAKAEIGRQEFLKELEAIPPAQRGMSMKAAFYGIMKKRFPCG